MPWRSSSSRHPEPAQRYDEVPLDSPHPEGWSGSPLDSPHPWGMVRAPGFTPPLGDGQGPWIHPTPGGWSGPPWTHPNPGGRSGYSWTLPTPRGWSGPLESPYPQGAVRVPLDSPHPQGMVRSPWIPLTPGDGQGPPAFLSGTDHHGCFLLLSCRFSKKGRAGVVRVSPRQAGLGALWLEVEVSWLRRAACDHVHMHGVTSPGEA